MEKKKTNERKVFKGLVEMNEFQKTEIKGGTIIPHLAVARLCRLIFRATLFNVTKNGYPENLNQITGKQKPKSLERVGKINNRIKK
jgi:hypothetical protein